MNKETTLSKEESEKLLEVLSSTKTPTPEMVALFSEDTIKLSAEDSLVFVESLNFPKEGNSRFMEAAKNYKKSVMETPEQQQDISYTPLPFSKLSMDYGG